MEAQREKTRMELIDDVVRLTKERDEAVELLRAASAPYGDKGARNDWYTECDALLRRHDKTKEGE